MGAEPTFGDLLRTARLDAGLTQEELAERASLSPRSISDLERGVNRTARKETARLLADALGLRDPTRARFLAVARGANRTPGAGAFGQWEAQCATSAAHLEVWTPTGVASAQLARPRVTIGRGADNDVALVHDRAVSRLHAVLEFVGNAWCAQDAGSRNGTYVRGERLAGLRALRDGDDLTVGCSTIVFRHDDPAACTQTEVASSVPERAGPDRIAPP